MCASSSGQLEVDVHSQQCNSRGPGLCLIREDIQCPVCVDVLQDPFVTSCGHTFCYTCISTQLKHKKSCPSCSTYLTQDQVFPNFLLKKIVHRSAVHHSMHHGPLVDSVAHLLKAAEPLTMKDLDQAIGLLKHRRDALHQQECTSSMLLLMRFLDHARDLRERRVSELELQLQCLTRDLESLKKGKHRSGLGHRVNGKWLGPMEGQGHPPSIPHNGHAALVGSGEAAGGSQQIFEMPQSDTPPGGMGPCGTSWQPSKQLSTREQSPGVVAGWDMAHLLPPVLPSFAKQWPSVPHEPLRGGGLEGVPPHEPLQMNGRPPDASPPLSSPNPTLPCVPPHAQQSNLPTWSHDSSAYQNLQALPGLVAPPLNPSLPLGYLQQAWGQGHLHQALVSSISKVPPPGSHPFPSQMAGPSTMSAAGAKYSQATPPVNSTWHTQLLPREGNTVGPPGPSHRPLLGHNPRSAFQPVQRPPCPRQPAGSIGAPEGLQPQPILWGSTRKNGDMALQNFPTPSRPAISSCNQPPQYGQKQVYHKMSRDKAAGAPDPPEMVAMPAWHVGGDAAIRREAVVVTGAEASASHVGSCDDAQPEGPQDMETNSRGPEGNDVIVGEGPVSGEVEPPGEGQVKEELGDDGPEVRGGEDAMRAAKKRRIHSHFDELQQCYLQMRHQKCHSSSVLNDQVGAFDPPGHQAAAGQEGAEGRSHAEDGTRRPPLPKELPTLVEGEDPKCPPLRQCRDSVGDLAVFSEMLQEATLYNRLSVLAHTRITNGRPGAAAILSSIDFDSEERLFAAAGVPQRVHIYDYQSMVTGGPGACSAPLREIPSRAKLSCLSFSRTTACHLVTSDYDGSVVLWDVEVGKAVQEYAGHDRRAWSVCYSPVDTRCFASGSDDGVVKVWREDQQDSLVRIDVRANVCSVHYHPTVAHQLVLGSAGHAVMVYDIRSVRQPLNVFLGHKKAVSYVRYMNPTEVVSASTDSSLRLWDMVSGECVRTYAGHSNERNFVGMSGDRQFIACGSETDEVFVYHKMIPKPLVSHCFRPDGGPPTSSSGQSTQLKSAAGSFISAVCWKRNSQVLVVANSQGNIWIINLEDAEM